MKKLVLFTITIMAALFVAPEQANADKRQLEEFRAGVNIGKPYGTIVKRLRHGTGTLVGGTVVVTDARVTAASLIFLTAQTTGAAPGALRVSARTAGTSFTVTSTSGTDTSTFAYLLIEP